MGDHIKDISFSPGLDGVAACKSKVGFIDGTKGILEYRGYAIEELAEHSTFEETAYLLLHGKLPQKQDLATFSEKLKKHRSLPTMIEGVLKSLSKEGHPMDALQVCIASMGHLYPFPEDSTPLLNEEVGIQLIGVLPTVIAAFHRLRTSQEIIQPDATLSHAGNFLYMITGKKPSDHDARIMDVCLILHAEHGLNASTFTTRVIGSTLAAPFSAICGATGALTGSLHGGANEAVVRMLQEIGSVENVRNYVMDKISKKQKIMGMGHRVYKTKDPRANILQKLARQLFKDGNNEKLLQIAEELEKVCLEILAPKGIFPNVDFYSGLVYRKMGIKADLHTCVFAAARVAGWMAHWTEQREDNRIFRPSQIYEGNHDQAYLPIDKR